MSAAAVTASCSTCRLPATLPHAWTIACWAVSKEPRVASTAARRCNPYECSRSGRFKAASAGYRLRVPSARQAQRLTRTLPNTVARWRRFPCSTLRWTAPSAQIGILGGLTVDENRRHRGSLGL